MAPVVQLPWPHPETERNIFHYSNLLNMEVVKKGTINWYKSWMPYVNWSNYIDIISSKRQSDYVIAAKTLLCS